MTGEMARAVRRVNGATLTRCRREIDSPSKKILRAALLPFIRSYLGLTSVGEGFQWGLPLNLPRKKVEIGRYAYIGAFCSASGPLEIGDLCMISTHVRFVGNDHLVGIVGGAMRLEFPSEERPLTVLESECWIGQGATIREGVTIGRGAVIAAGSVVTKSVEPYAIVAGCPARLVRYRFSADEMQRHDCALYE